MAAHPFRVRDHVFVVAALGQRVDEQGALAHVRAARVVRTTRRIYRVLQLDGYARVDYRLAEDGTFYFLEANPNPDIAKSEEFASASEAAGMPFPKLIQRVVDLGLQRAAGR